MTRTYIVYNLILLFTILFSICVAHAKTKGSEYLARTLLFLSVGIPAFIRQGIGTDYPYYAQLYRMYRHFEDDHELGFQLLAKLFWYFDASPHTFVVSLSIITLFLVVYFVPKKNYEFFIIIYFLTSYIKTISVGRQDVSIAIMICGIFALEKKYGTIKYIVASTLATLFHASSFLYYPVLLLRKVHIGPKTIIVMLICVCSLILSANIIDWLTSNPLFLSSKYSQYLDLEYYMKGGMIGTGLGVMANLILPICFLFFFKHTSKYVYDANFIGWLTLCFLASYLLSVQIYIFTRLVDVFRFVPPFIAYPTCKAISKKHPHLILFCFIILYTIIFEKTITEAQISLHRGLGVSPFITIFD